MLTTSYHLQYPSRPCIPTSPHTPPTSPLVRIRHFLSSPLLPIDEHTFDWYPALPGPDPNLELHSAAASGNVGLVHYALTHGQPVNSVLHGVLPIHAACSGGSVSVVKMLIERGADVNAPRLPRRYSDGKKSNVPSIGAAGECLLGSYQPLSARLRLLQARHHFTSRPPTDTPEWCRSSSHAALYPTNQTKMA